MNFKSTLLALASVALFATAQAQVKVGANPGSITSGAVLDVEGASGRSVVRQNGAMGINTTSPDASADLELGSANKALFLNRVANTAAVANPKPGMVIYDLSENCVKVYQGSPATWSGCLLGASAVGTVSALSCGSASFSPSSATQGSAYSGTLSVPYTGGNGGTYAAQSFSQNGLTFSLPAGSFATGAGSLSYAISGAPGNAGPMSVSLSAGGQSCASGSIPALSVNGTAPTNATGSGSLSGRACFDIAESNDNANNCGALSGRITNRANFNQAATYSQTYVFTPTGTVSNVRFVFVNTNGQVIQSLTPSANYSGSLSSGSSASAVAVYNQDLSSDTPGSTTNGLAFGKTRTNPLTADIYVVYNDGSGDKQLRLTANVKDCNCCGAYLGANQTQWKEFMCHNLGADYTADPFTPAAAIHGAKYQWGAQTGETGRYLSQSQDQASSGSISGWITSAKPAGTWTDAAKTTSDPCPTGYRVPSISQWQSVWNNNTKTYVGTWPASALGPQDNYGSAAYLTTASGGRLLMIPASGQRGKDDGIGTHRGATGQYWSSTSGGNGPGAAFWLSFNDSSVFFQAVSMTYGFAIRCIAE